MIRVLVLVFFIAGCGLSDAPQNVDDSFVDVQNHNRYATLISDVDCNSSTKSARLRYFSASVKRKVWDSSVSWRIVFEEIKIYLDADNKLFNYYITQSSGSTTKIEAGKSPNYKVSFGKLVIPDFAEILIHDNGSDLLLRRDGVEKDALLSSSLGPIKVKRSENKKFFTHICN